MQFFNELQDIWLEMAPYLMLGFLMAGMMKVLLPANFIYKYMGKHNKYSVINAALIGVPMPLCSCGVIPAGVSFAKNGAGKGSSVSFLVSTPQTGIDSMMVTYSLLGLPFTVLRPIIAFVTGIFGGWLTNAIDKDEMPQEKSSKVHEATESGNKIVRIVKYAFNEFFMDIAQWLVIGVLIAAAIAWLVPDDFFAQYAGNSWASMLIILVASIPLYVCATASVPIAAVLMLKGLSPGAALVFLMAGPATNAATITVIKQVLGNRTMFAYLFSIISGALLFGWLIDTFLPAQWFMSPLASQSHVHLLPHWIHWASGAIMLFALIYGYSQKIHKWIKAKQIKNKPTMNVTVEGMGCAMCSGKIEENLKKFEFINYVSADFKTGKVEIEGDNIDLKKVEDTITKLGYKYVG